VKKIWAGITLLIAIVLVITGQPAHAQFPQLAENHGGSSLCFNASGGGQNISTPVIAYNCGDPNNDYGYIALGTMCGNGYVTQTCPFTYGSGLNAAYVGDQIVIIGHSPGGTCVGGSTGTTPGASLQNCPQDNGTGGGDSTIDILELANVVNGTAYNVLINRNWSDYNWAHKTGACATNGGTYCAFVVGAPNGYRAQLVLNTGDSNVRSGNPSGASYWNQWGEI